MRDFARISPTFWTGRTGRELRAKGPLAQLLAMYLLTSPHHNYIGMYRLPTAYIADDLQLDADQVAQALTDIESACFAKYDKATSVVWVMEAARWQVVECREALKAGDKKCKGVQREFDELPTDCPFLDEFYAKYATACHMRPRNGMKAATTPAPHALPVEPPKVESPQAPTEPKADQAAEATPAPDYVPGPISVADSLHSFQNWRNEVVVANPTVEALIAQQVHALARSDGNIIANNALYAAYCANDPDCIAWTDYVQLARDRYYEREEDCAQTDAYCEASCDDI